ncbi:MAG: hypothetical protein A2287_07370 [Candidatus Melainabacteria bacterium RIFOXYA12_FULL_32_12]|nr:MAG: hypothetical protein A2255_06460 [Candidatus Melainabacteria bacterium RIFOXYA2_FULL_32_9]OGI30407.1 MAG: hypothetical protein A2287_07370 [Candidatus Melainabacteria bacterium RIFOXYA12_FULL_32_12]
MKRFFFYLTLILISYICAVIVNHPDNDLWARLAVGSLFFQTGGVLRHDIFAYTPTKDLWVDHEWGSGVIFYFFVDKFGDWGLFLLKAILLLMIFVLLSKIIRLYIEKNLHIEVFYFIFLAFSILPGIANLLRSQIFTLLFFVFWIYILERVRRGENRLLWTLPVTMIIWANLHGGFVTGLGLLLIYALGEYLNKKDFLKYLWILGLSILVTLINPYGINYWSYILDATTMSRSLIGEWMPVSLVDGPFHIINGVSIHILSGFFLFLLLTLIVGIRLLINQTKADWVKILLIGITLYLGLKHQRHVVFFIFVVSGLLYHQYLALFYSIFDLIKNKMGEKFSRYLVLSKNMLVYVLIISACMFFVPTLPNKIAVKPIFYPVGAFEFIKQNNLSGNLATTYGWGSYALWKLYPQCKVLIDGRYEEVYPNDVYELAMNFSEHLNDNWYKFLDYFHTDIIVASKLKYLSDDLEILGGWKVVYEDAVSVVFLPLDKIKDSYIYPNFRSRIYWQEDLSKPVNLN